MLFLALQIGNELLPDTVFLDCWRHTVLGTWWTHAQEYWPLELWTQLNYTPFRILARMSQWLYRLSCIEIVSQSCKDSLTIQHWFCPFSHCCVRVHAVQEVHKCVPWGYLVLVITVVRSELAALIFVSAFLRKHVIEVQCVLEYHRFKTVKSLYVPMLKLA